MGDISNVQHTQSHTKIAPTLESKDMYYGAVIMYLPQNKIMCIYRIEKQK